MDIATGVSMNGFRVFCDVVIADDGAFALRVATRPEGADALDDERVWHPPSSAPYVEQDVAEREAYRLLRRVRGVTQAGEPIYA